MSKKQLLALLQYLSAQHKVLSKMGDNYLNRPREFHDMDNAWADFTLSLDEKPEQPEQPTQTH